MDLQRPPLLAGLRVLDFTRVLAGPFATAMLADLGAEIIKIEPPGGDDYRAIGPMRNGESALFTAMNRNKKSIVLDLKQPAGLEALKKLIARADVMIWNNRPQSMARMKLAYDDVRSINPKIIYCGMFGFGQGVALTSQMGLAGIIEFVGGLLIAVGFLTGIAAFIASGEMAVAYFIAHFPRGPVPIRNQGELAILYCFVFLYIASRGAGIWGVDRASRR